MGPDSYTCKNCGASIAFSEGEVSVKCEYTGAYEVSAWRNVVLIQLDGTENDLYALQSDGALLSTDDRLPNSLNLSDIFIAPVN